MTSAASIRTLGRCYVRAARRNAARPSPSSVARKSSGVPPRSAAAAARAGPDDTPPAQAAAVMASAAVVASTLLLLPRDDEGYGDRSRSAACGALRRRVTEGLAFATPVKDIKAVYDLGEIIGEGGFGQVFRATCRADDREVALKCIPKEWTLREEFQREVDILRKLNVEDGGHPHICKMYSIYEDEDEYWMSMELIEGGELFEHLISEGAYSEAKAAVFMRQFAEALSFMHRAGVVHGDLKPENLLLSSWDNEEAELKLVDFGCAVIPANIDKRELPHSTLAYDPPERTRSPSRTRPTYQSDVWAAGCILYIILTGSHPFDKSGGSSDENVAELVKSIDTEERLSELVFDERTEGLSASARSLLRSMLHPDPLLRASSEWIQRNRWVQGLTASWDVLDGIDSKLERYWRRRFQDTINKKFGNLVGDDDLRAVFKEIDKDENGQIEFEELAKVLADMGTKPNDIRSIFDAINLDHDGGVSLEEFRSVMKNELSTQHYQKKFREIVAKELEDQNISTEKMSVAFDIAVRRLFNSMDLDHNGSLDCHELRVLLRNLGVDEKEISFLVASVDLNHDGSLSFDEFSKVMFGARSASLLRK